MSTDRPITVLSLTENSHGTGPNKNFYRTPYRDIAVAVFRHHCTRNAVASGLASIVKPLPYGMLSYAHIFFASNSRKIFHRYIVQNNNSSSRRKSLSDSHFFAAIFAAIYALNSFFLPSSRRTPLSYAHISLSHFNELIEMTGMSVVFLALRLSRCRPPMLAKLLI